MDIIFPSVLVARNIFFFMSSLIIILADFRVKIYISAYLQKDNNVDMFKQSEKDFKKKPIKNHTFSYSLCQTVQSTSHPVLLFLVCLAQRIWDHFFGLCGDNQSCIAPPLF